MTKDNGGLLKVEPSDEHSEEQTPVFHRLTDDDERWLEFKRLLELPDETPAFHCNLPSPEMYFCLNASHGNKTWPVLTMLNLIIVLFRVDCSHKNKPTPSEVRRELSDTAELINKLMIINAEHTGEVRRLLSFEEYDDEDDYHSWHYKLSARYETYMRAIEHVHRGKTGADDTLPRLVEVLDVFLLRIKGQGFAETAGESKNGKPDPWSIKGRDFIKIMAQLIGIKAPSKRAINDSIQKARESRNSSMRS